MIKDNELKKIHERLAIRVEEYIIAIKEKYGKFIPKQRLIQLEGIKDYSNSIKIYDYGSINGYASERH